VIKVIWIWVWYL